MSFSSHLRNVDFAEAFQTCVGHFNGSFSYENVQTFISNEKCLDIDLSGKVLLPASF